MSCPCSSIKTEVHSEGPCTPQSSETRAQSTPDRQINKTGKQTKKKTIVNFESNNK